jgi:hypothetical protein
LEENDKNFKGKVSWIGHSLGSVISYDIFIKQNLSQKQFDTSDEGPNGEPLCWSEEQDLQLDFEVENFFLLGSPLASFVTLVNDENFVRSKLPTCCEFYNIYHPLDLVAYRIEMLI